MKSKATVEERLEALGAELRKRPRVSDRVISEARRSNAERAVAEQPTGSRRATIRRRWPLFTAAAVAISAGLIVALAVLPSSSVGWEDVVKTVQSQKWIRGTVAFPDGRRGTMWLSPERRIWAFRSASSYRFFDGRERVKYEYHPGSERITKLPLGEEDLQRVIPVDALSQDKSALGPWLFGTEKIVQQKRREVTEGGKTWIEFQMVLWRRGTNQATLRVDPETRLPVYLLLTSPKDATKSFKWRFDYPADGPADVYALGVPRETEINDRMPSDEALRVLDLIAASRARIGDFRLLVAEQDGHRSHIVWRKGDRWRVELCKLQGDGFHQLSKPEDGQNLGDWFAERLKHSQRIPLYICDGKTVYRNPNPGRSDGKRIQWQPTRSPAPQDLMSSDGWLRFGLTYAPYVTLAPMVYPDLTPRGGSPFEFDPHPVDSPGCVLIKRSALLTDGSVGHEWCYIDPTKGHAVVRVELFSLPADTPPSPETNSGQSIRMEDFQQSPNGFWYPTVVHDTMPAPNQVKTTVRYQFDFDADLPDSLFTTGDAQVPKE